MVTPDVLALALTQHAPIVAWDSSVLPSTLALALTLETSTVLFPIQTILPSAFELALTLQTPVIVAGEAVVPDTLTLALTLHAPTIIVPFDRTVLPTTLALALALQVPDVMSGYAEITPAMLAALIDPYSGGAWLWFAEIAIPGYNAIRIARNTEDVVYAGITYTANNFDIGLAPLTGDGSVPRIMLQVVQDAEHTLEDKINVTQGAGGGTIKIIRAHEDFLTEFITALEQRVRILTSESNTTHVIFSCGIPNPLIKKIPTRRYSSKTCPYAAVRLFKGPECQYSGADPTCTGKFEDCHTKGNSANWGAEIALDPNALRI